MNNDSDVTVRVAHRFNQSAEQVFDAWLDSANAGKWLFATPTGQVERVEIDARVGGSFIVVDRRESEDVAHVGTYLAIDRPHLLSFSFAVPKYSPDSARVTVEITPLAAGCELVLTQYIPASHAEYARSTEEGWMKILDKLETILG